MASTKQILANQRNGKRSNGPISNDGKAVARMNAVKHGLLAKEAIIEGDNVDEYDSFKTGVYASLQPIGGIEALFVDRIVSSAWRLRRVIKIESMLFEEKDLHWVSDKGISEAFCGVSKDRMAVLSRYEAGIERSMLKALHELQRLQAARMNGVMLPPVAIDVEMGLENGFVS